MLFNLQGAHRFQRRAFILPQRPFLVKHFFQAFSNLFVLSFADPSPSFAVLADILVILPRSFSFVKHFFQVFANFFVPFPGKPSWWPLPSQTGRQLIEDITAGIICQALFSGFSTGRASAGPIGFLTEILKRFSPKAFQQPCRKRSLIIAKSPPLVNTFFQFF